MKLSHISIAGFRGFREPVKLELSESFNIICGRNGVGKSTIFDALEYAITGSLDKYTGLGAAKDRPTDYIWWRGDGAPKHHDVAIGFRDSSGKTTELLRSRDAGAQLSAEDIEHLLCEPNKPDRALYQLCRTSIIRDELIAALSVDLSENDRFDLVRSALGEVEASQHVAKARKIIAVAEARVKAADDRYESARETLTRTLSELAVAQAELAAGTDVETALRLIRTHTTKAETNLPALLADARRAALSIRETSEALGAAHQQIDEISALRQEIASPDYQEKKASAIARLAQATQITAGIERRLEDAKSVLQREQEADAMASALSSLISNGRHLGLHDGHCPLCNATRSQKEFDEGLAIAGRRLNNMKSGVPVAQIVVSTLLKEQRDAAQNQKDAHSQHDQLVAREISLNDREAESVMHFSRHNLNPALIEDTVALEKEAARQRDLWLNLSRALASVEASGAADRVASIQLRASSLQREVDAASKEMEGAERVVAAAKAIDRAVRRSGDEIIDESLAVISPLLGEIYQRLRPHAKWRSIEYSIRGDVRRFLSLRVGQGLNPQFLFSSGQRRAAGIAFLLSVHLSRPWCKLNTILLDDPVQHIDDFRALHLVEVIAALRRTGRQIVCAVEDADLADLLCRRLTSEDGGPGNRFDIDSDGVIHRQTIPVLPPSVLRDVEARVS